MENKNSLKIWVTKSSFDLIQEGTYPKDFQVTPPESTANYVEMTVSMETLQEWRSNQKQKYKPTKNFLFD